MRRAAIAVAFFSSTAFCPSFWADCPDGIYNFTDVDKKFMTDTVAVIQAAVPPALEGWRLDDVYRRPVRPGVPLPVWTSPNTSCKGAEGVPLIVAYDVKYFWVAGEKDLVQKQNEIRKKMAAVQRTPLPADQQKLLTELDIKNRDLRFEARKFAKTDKAEADRLNAEAAVFGKQANEIRLLHGNALKPQLDALQKEDDALRANSPLEVNFSIHVNTRGVDSRDLKPSNAQAGAATTLTNAKRTLLLYGAGLGRRIPTVQ